MDLKISVFKYVKQPAGTPDELVANGEGMIDHCSIKWLGNPAQGRGQSPVNAS
jgi:hypothetical protein